MLSVVITTHNDPLGLYLTYFSLVQQLETSGLEWEIVIAADGGSEYKWEKQPNTRCLRIQTGSPQGTRDAGIKHAKYPAILCVESHVIVSNVKTWLEKHCAKKAAISFPARIGEGPEMFNVYGSLTDWDGKLWYKHHLYQSQGEAYKVAQFGHSAFILNRDEYISSGGYTTLLKGWGGEEPLLCLKFWMLGKECWFFPDIWHAHYLTPNAHGSAMVSEDYAKNFKIVKFLITGQAPPGLFLTPEILAERKRICEGPFAGDVTKLREYFKQEGVVG